MSTVCFNELFELKTLKTKPDKLLFVEIKLGNLGIQMNCFKSLLSHSYTLNLLNRHVGGVNSVLLPVSIVLQGGKDETDI